MELLHVLVVALVAHAVLVAVCVERAGKRIARAMAEAVSGMYETGARPEVDYPIFDEALARIHLEQAEDIQFGGELSLEYDPQKVDF